MAPERRSLPREFDCRLIPSRYLVLWLTASNQQSGPPRRSTHRSRHRYAQTTLEGYEITLRVRVLSHTDLRSGLPLGDLPASAIDTRTAQNLVDAVTARESHARARAAAAALAAVLRDG